MTGQYQAARSASQGGNQVGLGAVGGDILDLGAKAQVFQPTGQQVYDGAVALVPVRVG